MERIDGRNYNELRPVSLTKGFISCAEGSVLITAGKTRVICNATVEEKVPPYKKGSGEGWVTAEYAMLPRATAQRNNRDIKNLKLNGRSAEIQRLIGRALRSCVDLSLLGERTIIVDCDVIEADGGTRTASITGGYVALALALNKLVKDGLLEQNPLISCVAAISCGIVNGDVLLDLCYQEDSCADVDMNVIMNDRGEFVELQGTGEKTTFREDELQALLAVAKKGILELQAMQQTLLQEDL